MESLFSELKININSKATIWCDNLSTFSLIANPILHSITKHMKLDLHSIREQVLKRKLAVNHLPPIYQKADILTKALSACSFLCLKLKLKVDTFNSKNP